MTMSRRGITAWAALVAIGALLFAAPAASASQGSIPAEVTGYATDADGLLARLDDLFGVGSGGKGIEFGDTTKVGQLNRIFVFTDGFLADEKTDTPVERANEWTAPITIDEKPIGLATIWINPATVEPELADFVQDAGSAAALADVPAEAYLVHDEPRGAWFTLVEDTLTPVLAGSSGLTAPISLAAYQSLLSDAAGDPNPAGETANTGTILSIMIILAAALAVIIVLAIPTIRGRRSRPRDAATLTDPLAPAPKPAEEVTVPDEPLMVAKKPITAKKPATTARKPGTSSAVTPRVTRSERE